MAAQAQIQFDILVQYVRRRRFKLNRPTIQEVAKRGRRQHFDRHVQTLGHCRKLTLLCLGDFKRKAHIDNLCQKVQTSYLATHRALSAAYAANRAFAVCTITAVAGASLSCSTSITA